MVDDKKRAVGWQLWATVIALAAIEVDGRRMSEPYVAYGIERYRYR